MINDIEHVNRQWPWNIDEDEDNFLEPYDEFEEVKKTKDDWNDY